MKAFREQSLRPFAVSELKHNCGRRTTDASGGVSRECFGNRTFMKQAIFRLVSLIILTVGEPFFTVNGAISDNPAQQPVKTRVSVLPVDLTRVPTTEELMAAGQLGGILYPTCELQDTNRAAAARLDFGKAIDQWNQHNYTNAVELFKRHVAEFPDSPWAAEASLHEGCDATYNGRYSEAESIFTQLIADYQGNTNFGAKMMLNKATQRLALVKVEEDNFDEANQLFLELKSSPDWKQRTYAAHWLQRLSRFAAAREALVNCGAEALAYVLKKDGHETAALQVQTNIPASMRGHSMAELVRLAAKQGYEMTALHIEISDLPQLPLPAVLHISPGNSGDKGHYWVLDKVQGDHLEMFDPQSKRRFHQTTEELAEQWSGDVLVLSDGSKNLPGQEMDPSAMEEDLGGCCGAPRPPDDMGDPGGNGGDGGSGNCGGGGGGGDSFGAPRWIVDMISMNMFMTDTPMWHDSAIGPRVRISVSYNSQSSIAQYEPFGNKWTFNYGGYLIMDTSGTVIVFMPDGREDSYTPNGSGGYTPPFGIQNTLTQIAPNHFQLQFPNGTVYVYSIPTGTTSQQPFLTEIDDSYGNQLTLGYNSGVQLTTITDAQGNLFTLSYNASGLVTNVADPFGRNASFQYDESNNLTQITDMGGYWSSMTYNADAFVTSITDARGTTGFYTELPGPAGNNSNNYPPPGDTNMFACYRITVTNAVGDRAEYFYYGGCDIDGYGAISDAGAGSMDSCAGYSWYVSPRDYIPWRSQTVNNYRSEAPKTRYLPTTVDSGQRGEIGEILYPAGDYFKYAYDNATGDRTAVTDAHGYTWGYTYNPLGLPTTITDPKGTLTTLMYATNNFDLVAVSNGLGVISMTYNPQHSIVSFTDRLTNATTFSYNAYGQLTNEVDALAITNQYLYDVNSRLVNVLRAGATVDSFTYDSLGRVSTATDATGLTVTNLYDNLDRFVSMTYPDGKFDSYVYSTCCPHLIDSITDRGGQTVNFNYDALKRLTQVVDPEGGMIQYSYDANGNMTALTDPNGNVTRFAYNLDNRIVKKQYADGTAISVGYDHGGFLTNRINGRGISATYAYDQNENLLSTSYSDGTSGVSNTWDNFNRLTQVVDGIGTNVYSYNADSWLLSYEGPWPSDTITYSYDALERKTNVLAQLGQPVGYIYDALDRLTQVQTSSGNYSYSYSSASPLVETLSRSSGSYTTNAYDLLNRLTLIANDSPTGMINQFTYTYNSQDLCRSETVSNGFPVAYSTNPLVAYKYNSINQVLNSTPPAQLFAYDADGNMTRGCTPDGYVWTGNYDAENRLTSLVYTNADAVIISNAYAYAANSFLAEMKRFTNDVLCNDTRFIRTSELPLQERDASNNVSRDYVWGLGEGGGIGGLLALNQGAGSYSYFYDGKGNVVAVQDASGATVAAYGYDAFGDQMEESGTLEQPFRFSTKPYDQQTGLVYFGYRFYMPQVGRWLSSRLLKSG